MSADDALRGANASRQNSTDPGGAEPRSPRSAAGADTSVEFRRGAPGDAEPRWAVIIPVKPAARGKSRLQVDGVDRIALARAIAVDTIAAVTQCPLVAQVYVVTDDPALPLAAIDVPGLRFVPEDDPAGLNAAIGAGMAAAGERMPRAALLGDLPALRPGDLADALRIAASLPRAVVADAEGTGSTLVTAAPGLPWTSAFGDGSLLRHVALGCAALEITDASTLRRDVDTAEQLAAAASLGLGPRTAALVAGSPPQISR